MRGNMLDVRQKQVDADMRVWDESLSCNSRNQLVYTQEYRSQ